MKINFIIAFVCIKTMSIAQVGMPYTFFQYSMTPFNPTALPYNYFDKFDRPKSRRAPEKEVSKFQSGLYLNLATRSEVLSNTSVSTSGIFCIDKINDPKFDKYPIKFGGGLMYTDYDVARMVSGFVHAGYAVTLDVDWRLSGGVGYRFSKDNSNRILTHYQHQEDSKIDAIFSSENASIQTISLGVALINVKHFYAGIGVTRNWGSIRYNNADHSGFGEANLLMQWSFGKPNMELMDVRTRDPRQTSERQNFNRGFFSNHNLSLVTKYNLKNNTYPIHLQLNYRTSVNNSFWMGLGGSTAKRVQFQFGFLKIPIFKMDASTDEYQIWVAYDLPVGHLALSKHGIEITGGYYF
jgi:hypothetical protein